VSPPSPRAAPHPSLLPVGNREPGTRLAGVIMTKAGSKGGNLRDKLDGNELDLSLSDLNEVPVKELVSTTPRASGAHLLLTPAPRGQAPLLSLSFPFFKKLGLLGGCGRSQYSYCGAHVSLWHSSRR
jgi:hypothetical protein